MAVEKNQQQRTRSAIPKYKKLAEQIRTQIESGKLQSGDRLPSFSEMRARFGATPTTVEWVFGELERDGLIVRERGRGTFVAPPKPRVLTGTIGIGGISFAPQFRHPYWSHFLSGAQEAATRAEVELLLINDASFVRWEKIDGLISCEYRPHEASYQIPDAMPRVAALALLPDTTCVVADDFGGLRDATRYLLKNGHKRIGFLMETHLPRRLEGYRAALQEAGIDAKPEWVFTSEKEEARSGAAYFEMGRDLMTQWLARGWKKTRCTALLAQNDDVALGAIAALQEAGFVVPDGVSVIGFDGTEIGEYSQPRLTSIEVPLHAIGADAVRLVLEQLHSDGANSPKTVTHPVKLKVRASTRAL